MGRNSCIERFFSLKGLKTEIVETGVFWLALDIDREIDMVDDEIIYIDHFPNRQARLNLVF